MIRRHLYVTGQVQGVFFRDSCRAEADRLGVSGWARNLDDGRVEVVAEGGEDAVRELEQWCGRGSEQAEVSGVEASDESPEQLAGFQTR